MFTGSNSGKIIVNIDDLGDRYQGSAYLHPDDGSLPSSAALFTTANKENPFRVRTDALSPLDVRTGAAFETRDKFQEQYPGLTAAGYVDIEGEWTPEALAVSWKNDLGVEGKSTLPKTSAASPSELVPRLNDWREYREYVSTLQRRRFLFRGQNKPWRLRSSYHRTGRAHLPRFLAEDVQILHRHLSAKTRHVFNLSIPDENGSFFNLIQHHGYPTPLLDWTYSPYVAAFFAFRGISNAEAEAADPADRVRILMLDAVEWKLMPQVLTVVNAWHHFSIGEFIAIENERMIPQQAVSSVTNIDDIESYIRALEKGGNKQYLWAIDLPKRARREVVQDLAYMGITAGSMFPGLDGACEEIAERSFGL